MTPGNRSSSRVRIVAYGIAILGASISAFATLGAVIYIFTNDQAMLSALLRDHARAILGLPFSMVCSFCLVLLLEGSIGPIEFEALGMKFKGASGPVVLCVFCFLAMSMALYLLW